MFNAISKLLDMFETAEVVAEVSFFSKLTNLYCYFSVLSINFWLLFI